MSASTNQRGKEQQLYDITQQDWQGAPGAQQYRTGGNGGWQANGYNPDAYQPYNNQPGQGFGGVDKNPYEEAYEGLMAPKLNLEGSVRLGFIRKVYSILAVQLSVTAIFVSAVLSSDRFEYWLHQNPWVLVMSSIASVIILYALGCYRSVARSVPINYILLAVFTLCESLLVAAISSQYDTRTVFIAAVLTAAVVIGLTIYAFNTKTDFTILGGLLFILVLVLAAAGIVSIFIRNRWLQLAISIGATILFGIYLIYDTQLILGNQRNALTVDDYIWAAMMLYIDIIQLFIHILRLLGNKSN